MKARRRSAPGLSVVVESERFDGVSLARRPPRRRAGPPAAAAPTDARPNDTTHTGKTSYWDERYTKDPEPFDWYQRYSGIQELLQKLSLIHI